MSFILLRLSGGELVSDANRFGLQFLAGGYEADEDGIHRIVF